MTRRVVHQLRRALRQPFHVWLDLVYAQVVLLVAQVIVWRRPVGKLLTDAAEETKTIEKTKSTLETAVLGPANSLAARYARAVRRTGAHGVFRPKCLVRSVALNMMLERAGITGSRIRIGVRLDDGNFSAHAWVELNERVLGDRPDHTGRFVELADVRLAQTGFHSTLRRP